MKLCRITFPDKGSYTTVEYNDGCSAVYDIARNILGSREKNVLFTDIDGPMGTDDMALLYWGMIDPRNGDAKFKATSRAIVDAAEAGKYPYGFTLVVMAEANRRDGKVLEPDILAAVGRNVRLTPGAPEFVRMAGEAGYRDVVAVTTAYEGSAIEICRRLGITDCLSIVFDGDRLETFCGGYGKSVQANRWIKAMGKKKNDIACMGDSFTDAQMLEDFRSSGSFAFNPQYRQISHLAAANVYGPDVRGVLPLIDCRQAVRGAGDEIVPEWVVFNGDASKPHELAAEEIAYAKVMRTRIDRAVESARPKEHVLAAIRDDAGVDGGVIIDMSQMDVQRAVEDAIAKHAGMLETLRQKH